MFELSTKQLRDAIYRVLDENPAEDGSDNDVANQCAIAIIAAEAKKELE